MTQTDRLERSSVRLVVGLGNPGKEYATTRHNAGWIVLDALAKQLGVGEWTSDSTFESFTAKILPNPPLRKEGTSPFAKGDRGGFTLVDSVLLAKPTTFMNNSGRAVQSIRAYYNIDPEDIIVIHDELDLPLGTVRTRLGGTSAGHNGVGSLIHHLGTDQFWRVRVGIAPPPPHQGGETTARDATEYVLDRFSKEEWAVLDRIVDETASRLLEWLTSGSIPETSFTVE